MYLILCNVVNGGMIVKSLDKEEKYIITVYYLYIDLMSVPSLARTHAFDLLR